MPFLFVIAPFSIYLLTLLYVQYWGVVRLHRRALAIFQNRMLAQGCWRWQAVQERVARAKMQLIGGRYQSFGLSKVSSSALGLGLADWKQWLNSSCTVKAFISFVAKQGYYFYYYYYYYFNLIITKCLLPCFLIKTKIY